MIDAGVGFFLINFISETTIAHQSVAVSATTSSVIWKTGQPDGWAGNFGGSTEGVVLPGIMAGEIISAYEQARGDNFAPLENGNFDTHFEPTGGGLFISFPIIEGPKAAFARPNPMPTPKQGCLSGCFTGTAYLVSVTGARVSVERRPSL